MVRQSSIAASSVPSGADRRREKRYQVDLPGTIQAGIVICPVLVSDLSASGALVTFDDASEGGNFPAGAQIRLILEEFGGIEARIAHVGSNFYGLSLLDSHLFRDRLTAWLRQEIGAA